MDVVTNDTRDDGLPQWYGIDDGVEVSTQTEQKEAEKDDINKQLEDMRKLVDLMLAGQALILNDKLVDLRTSDTNTNEGGTYGLIASPEAQTCEKLERVPVATVSAQEFVADTAGRQHIAEIPEAQTCEKLVPVPTVSAQEFVADTAGRQDIAEILEAQTCEELVTVPSVSAQEFVEDTAGRQDITEIPEAQTCEKLVLVPTVSAQEFVADTASRQDITEIPEAQTCEKLVLVPTVSAQEFVEDLAGRQDITEIPEAQTCEELVPVPTVTAQEFVADTAGRQDITEIPEAQTCEELVPVPTVSARELVADTAGRQELIDPPAGQIFKRGATGWTADNALELVLDEFIDKYKQEHRRPSTSEMLSVREAAAKRWQSIDDDKVDERYQNMLGEKSKTAQAWYEIVDLLYKDTLAAVAGCGTCCTAGSAGHGKKCLNIAKKLMKLDLAHGEDCKMVGKLLVKTEGLFPWSCELRQAMTSIENKLLDEAG